MNKLRLVSVFALIMLLLNGILLFKLYKGGTDEPQRPRGNEKPKNMIIRELGFDDGQAAKFEELIKDHKRGSKKIHDQLRDTRERYFGTLKYAVDANDKDLLELNGDMARLHKELNELNYQHFKDIRDLCTPEQREKFNALLDKLGRKFMGPPPPRHGRGRPDGPPPHRPPH